MFETHDQFGRPAGWTPCDTADWKSALRWSHSPIQGSTFDVSPFPVPHADNDVPAPGKPRPLAPALEIQRRRCRPAHPALVPAPGRLARFRLHSLHLGDCALQIV